MALLLKCIWNLISLQFTDLIQITIISPLATITSGQVSLFLALALTADSPH